MKKYSKMMYLVWENWFSHGKSKERGTAPKNVP
jgi:hypothetical protein